MANTEAAAVASVNGTLPFRGGMNLDRLQLACACIALLLAGLAALASLAHRSRRRIHRSISFKSVISMLSTTDDDDDYSDISSSSDEDEEPNADAADERDDAFKYFFNYETEEEEEAKERFSWQELCSGGVVKAWDGIGLGFDRSRDLVSLLDLNRWETLRSFPAAAAAQIPAVVMPSSSVLLSAVAEEDTGAVTVRSWDGRVGGGAPAHSAAGVSRRRRVTGIGCWDVDMRNARSGWGDE